MFGEYITFGQSIIVTVFSMIVVFISLLVISYIMDLTRIIIAKKDNKITEETKIVQPIINTVVQDDDTELVAVITAAIAAITGTNPTGLVVRNIKRLPDLDSTWSKTGKVELMR